MGFSRVIQRFLFIGFWKIYFLGKKVFLLHKIIVCVNGTVNDEKIDSNPAAYRKNRAWNRSV